jgi:hypothetical protein
VWFGLCIGNIKGQYFSHLALRLYKNIKLESLFETKSAKFEVESLFSLTGVKIHNSGIFMKYIIISILYIHNYIM